jgi:hypothetical protein
MTLMSSGMKATVGSVGSGCGGLGWEEAQRRASTHRTEGDNLLKRR